MHPEFVALLVREPSELHYRSLVAVPAGLAPPPLRVDSKLVALLRIFGQAARGGVAGRKSGSTRQLPPEELECCGSAGSICSCRLSPTPSAPNRSLALGVKRFEEPYRRKTATCWR